jgi:hypothetical protein
MYIYNGNEDVRLTSVTALRFFSGLPSVQELFLNILQKKVSEPLVEAIIHALHDGYDYTQDFIIDLELLTKVTISLSCKPYCHSWLRKKRHSNMEFSFSGF